MENQSSHLDSAVTETPSGRGDSVGGGEWSHIEDFSQLQGKRLANRYRLTRLLDHGGFGAVYEAEDDKFPGRFVAVKLGKAVTNEKAFSREAMLIGQLNHECVVKVHDHGCEGGLPYIVMDMLDGERLDQLAARYQDRFPKDLLIKFIREIGTALHNVHAKNLIHRDLKPKNIMLVNTGSVDERGNPLHRFVLLDFGIATKFDATNSLKNHTMDGAGTPEYMSPEQVLGSGQNPLSDVYAFGVILYQLMVGRVPFPLENNTLASLAKVFVAIEKEDPPRFSSVKPNEDFDPRFEAIVRQCLAKHPEDRPANLAQVRNQLLETLEEVPVLQPVEHVQGSKTTLLVAAGAIFLALACVLWMVFAPQPVSGPAEFEIIARDQLTLLAGESQPFTLAVRSPESSPVEFTVVKKPENCEVTISASGNGLQADCSISADLNISPGDYDLVLAAKQGAIHEEFPVKLTISAPNFWLPKLGRFHVEKEGKLVRIDRLNYYEQLIYQVPGEKPVRFKLINPSHLNPRQSGSGPIPTSPFYMSESKVWSSIYAKFAEETPNLSNRRSDSSENRTADSSEYPAVDLPFRDALGFANWLGGEQMHLPTVHQWWIAAGYFDSPRPADYDSGPFRTSRVDAGRELKLNRFLPVDETHLDCDVSPYGIRQMAINGMEWTCSPYNPREVVDSSVGENVILCLVGNPVENDRMTYSKGDSYFNSAFQDFETAPAGMDRGGIGFRLVLVP